jgi:Zn-finger nucleic acid-binding protein
MEKAALGQPERRLVLDHCNRCGGVWFERGEAQQLGLRAPADLWALVPPRTHIMKPPCHGCGTPLSRDERVCGVCKRANELMCPACDVRTARVHHGTLTLDVCSTCKGVWFDHAELKSIWALELSALARRRQPGISTGDGADLLAAALIWSPDLLFLGGHVAASGFGHAAGAAADIAAGGAGEVASGILGGIGSAAESVFETITEIIASLFDG